MNEINIATLFSGIGAPEQGALRVYDKVNTIFACEFDKFARQSYNANYKIDPVHFHKDVNDLDATEYKGKVDILIGGSPCQAFSLAGLRNGTDDTRGQLIYQYIRVVDECKPPIIVYENVRGMMSIDNGNTIKDFVQALRNIGYHCHYGIVNTKHYGVPQNRERLFLVGFLDSDIYHKYSFGDRVPLINNLKDIQEDTVDKKYILSEKLSLYVVNRIKDRFTKLDGNISTTLMAQYSHSTTGTFIRVQSATKIGYEIAVVGDSINLSVPKSKTRRGRVGKQIAQCLDTACNQVIAGEVIRKFTPRECLRLQDFPDSFKIIVTDAQAYKQAGNSMSVNILEMIFKQIEKAKSGESVGLY